MKLKLLAILFLVGSYSFGQSYVSIVAEAETLYNNKEYDKSAEKYKSAFLVEQSNSSDLYNAACSAALAGNQNLAFEWLNLAMQKGWTNIRHLKADTDLASLHGTEQWKKLVDQMQKESDLKEANYDKPLQEKLLTIFEEDQAIRHQYISAAKEFGYESWQVDSLGKIMLYKDSINLVKVTEILDKHGWVGPDKVGGQANQTLFLVIQHADLQTQQKYLPMMREAVKNKKANPASLALLEDRVALGEGRKQIYGSQIGRDSKTQKHYVLPLEDPDNVDKRRQSMGLGPMADYVKLWDITWDAEAYKKELLEIEEKQKKEK